MKILTDDEYKNLRNDSLKLIALEQAGVDNWEWYGEAMQIYNQLKEEENQI